MPAGGGDPYIEDFDGRLFDFRGTPHALHRLYSRGPLKVLARCTPLGWAPGEPEPPGDARQYFSGVDVHLGDCKIVVGTDGRTHVILGDPAKPDFHITIEAKVDTLDAPNHPGCTSEEPHPLQGVPHVNVTMPVHPRHRLGESGVWVAGPEAAERPGDFVMPG